MPVKETTYKRSIVKELFSGGALSSTEIGNRIGKSLSLTIKTLNSLADAGVVAENGLAPSNGGRRPLTYSLKPDAFFLVAVAMDQFVSRVSVANAHLDFLGSPAEIELNLSDNKDALDILIRNILSAIEKSGIDKSKFIGIGIAMPGFINSRKGTNYTFLGANISARIKSQTGIPVFIENDSSAIALAEYKNGAAEEHSNILSVNMGWGVGLGMIINSKLFRGNDGFAGEFSHIPLFLNGKLCSCGKTGCLETETSLSYLLDTVSEKIKSGRDSLLKKRLKNSQTREEKYRQFIEAAKAGDSLVVETISEAGYKLGRGIAVLIHILNPEKIILSGRCAAAGKIWLAPVHQAINEFCIPRLVENTQIELSSLNHEADLLGAAMVVVENINETFLDKIINTYETAIKRTTIHSQIKQVI